MARLKAVPFIQRFFVNREFFGSLLNPLNLPSHGLPAFEPGPRLLLR